MNGANEQGGGPGRHETPEERADRLWTEMLQEVRVCQTGAQILFGFLLSVAFTPRFAGLGGFDKGLYVVTMVLGACATGALIAPVAFHRFFTGHDLKPELIKVGARLITMGLCLLGLTIGTALLLLLRVATGNDALAWAIAGAVLAWFLVGWLLLPYSVLRNAERRQRRARG
ncbi:hypothetical protein GXW83_14215 [Streptacidiphilus sp. PB12-B1b]|uniref:DUF6328 family protein n=1 Tax=Streptacidiphilus sp. PB12-B1b TaxID=2705012 RepID=UPI0015F8225A|nr:DUF6328 family protein [Streptacidiphilus sp. PB12-B1b]QMU76722.1 hypothetical protein GXW83_14215 [Streptacidiphilus sp. PB12-B1b]